MPEQEQGIINPARVTTRVMEQSSHSLGERTQQHKVSVADTPDGEIFILLGSKRQVSHLIEIYGDLDHKPTVQEITHFQHDHPSDRVLRRSVLDVPITQLRNHIDGGHELIEGVFAPVSPSIHDADATGVWAPARIALGNEWKLVENPL